jgi:hypothetical protein
LFNHWFGDRSMSLGIALAPHDRQQRVRVERMLAVPVCDEADLSRLLAEQTNQAGANMGFAPVVLASIALWGGLGFAIRMALHG